MNSHKLRIKRKSDNKIVCCYQEGLTMVPDTGELYQGNMNVTDKYIISRFTGLVDKNEEEIFEHDNVRVSRYGGELVAEGLIYFEKGMFKMENGICIGSETIGNFSQDIRELIKD